MAEIDTSIYKVAPTDPMTTVGNALSIANTAKQNQILGIQQQIYDAQNQTVQGTLQGQIQYGNALNATQNPDGTYNAPAAAGAYVKAGGNPIYAPTAATHATGLGGAAITNADALSKQNQDQGSDAIAEANAIMAAGGKRADAMNALNTRLSNGTLTPKAYLGITHDMPPDDKGTTEYFSTRAAGRIAPTVQAAPTVAGVDPNTGQPILKPAAKVTAAAAKPGGTTTTLPLGAGDVIAKNQALQQEDQLVSSRRMADLRPLQSALPLLQQLGSANFGPGSADFAKVKGALAAAGIIDPNTSDLQVRQEANKYLLQYAAGAQQAGRSDAALSSALGSNPNLDLTQPANLTLVKSQIARDRMDAAIQKGFAAEAKPGQTYSDYKSSYYQEHDPRAFQIDTMTHDERAALQKSLGPKTSPAYQKFVKSYNLAKSAGMVTPAGGQ